MITGLVAKDNRSCFYNLIDSEFTESFGVDEKNMPVFQTGAEQRIWTMNFILESLHSIYTLHPSLCPFGNILTYLTRFKPYFYTNDLISKTKFYTKYRSFFDKHYPIILRGSDWNYSIRYANSGGWTTTTSTTMNYPIYTYITTNNTGWR